MLASAHQDLLATEVPTLPADCGKETRGVDFESVWFFGWDRCLSPFLDIMWGASRQCAQPSVLWCHVAARQNCAILALSVHGDTIICWTPFQFRTIFTDVECILSKLFAGSPFFAAAAFQCRGHLGH